MTPHEAHHGSALNLHEPSSHDFASHHDTYSSLYGHHNY
jgi:hypothetical protein